MAERFVLDASVALAWFLPETEAGSRYAAAVLRSIAEDDAICVVPAIFHIEVAATLLRKRRDRRARFGKAKFEAALASLADLRIHTELTYYRVDTLAALAQRHHAQGFDAVYVDLARRLKLSLATIDRGLRSAARRTSVPVFDPALTASPAP